MTARGGVQAFHPFTRLNRLLDGIPPGRPPVGDDPIILSLGEPRRQPPDFVAEEIARAASGWSRYPPPGGSAAYREAAAAWLQRRYGLQPAVLQSGGMADPNGAILPLPGTREGLFFAVLAAASSRPDTERPAVLIPNPFYHVYAGAAAAAGLEPVFVPATAETDFLPDYSALDPGVLARTAICTLNSPSNPQGAVADLDHLKATILLARRHNFVVAFDECYADIYDDEPPTGALQAASDLDGSLENMLVFHSLSKRSSAPGLRCGFAAGAPRLIEALDAVLKVGGAGVPLPVLAAGTRLWQEEEHVVETRVHYRANFEVAERILGARFGFRRPAGGFFLWLDVGDGEVAARRLWREAGIKVLPGAYMGVADTSGVNPGSSYIRVALVDDRILTEAVLARIVEII